ncbi:competence protein ComEA [Halobacillus dabanensis]|uniref:Competence protein ComEA n=1 Tax=Halobacillus dabanensis TaxID=240302 RepID=A0A1I3PCG9_HALDA|nr:ComEA family DNA-binding protein [Halobacillus dabanensis]SFJ19030.1 competence protein ComEA [Halobacillus dabanensis]
MRKLKKYAWIGFIVLISIIIFMQKTPENLTEPIVEEGSVVEAKQGDKVQDDTMAEVVKVDIKGEVQKPGVYTLSSDKRVDDAIKEAGGMKDSADNSSVNLAQKLQDEMVIHVTAIQEGGQVEIASTSEAIISINTATLSDIESLKGIGPSKAAAIIAYREENGPFSSIEELVEVPGIGEKTLENIKETIRIP